MEMKIDLSGYEKFLQKGYKELEKRVDALKKKGYKETSSEEDKKNHIHTLVVVVERIPKKEFYVEEIVIKPSSDLCYDYYIESTYDEEKLLPYTETANVSYCDHNPYKANMESENGSQPGND